MRFDRSLARLSAMLFLAVAVTTTLFLAVPALGQTIPTVVVAEPVPATPNAFLQTMLVPLLGALGLVLSAALAFLATYLKNKSAVENTNAGLKVAELLGSKVASIMESVVAGLWAGMREPMIEASKDGVLTEAEKAKLRDAAVSQFLASLGDGFKAQLLGGLGLSETGLATMAAGLAEKAVNELKVKTAREAAVKAQAESIVAQANQAAAAAAKPEDVVARLAGGELPKP